MNIKKKIVSLISTVTMLTSVFTVVSVSAYDVPSEFDLPAGVTYYSNTNGNGQSYIPGTNYILEASSAYKTSGNYSLHLAAPNEYSNVQMRVGLELKEALSTSSTYRITGKAVRISEYGINAWWNCVDMYYGTSLESITKVGNIVCSDNYASKGFADFSFDVTPKSAAKLLAFYTWQGNYYIDDMSCKVVNSDGTLGDELLVNGGFESIAMPTQQAYPKGVYYWSNGYVPGTNYTLQAESTTGYVKSGKYALNFNTSSGQIANVQIAIKIPMKKPLTVGKTYKVSYDMSRWARSSSWWSSFRMQFEGATGGSQIVDTSLTNLDDCGWRSKSFDVTMTCDAKDVQFYTWQGDYSVDNLSIVEKNADGTYGTYNYVFNGDFETVEVDNYTELENVVAYAANAPGVATVSWTNPDIAVSDVVVKLNGEAVDASVDTAAGKFNQVVIEELTAGTTYNVEVSATINGVTKVYNKSFVATDGLDWTREIATINPDSCVAIARDGGGYANSDIYVAEEDGNRFVKVQGNVPNAPGNTFAGVQLKLNNLDQYYTYKLKFKAKGENTSKLTFISESATAGSGWAHEGEVTLLANSWDTYEILLDGFNDVNGDMYDSTLTIMSENFAGYFAIDDVELYAYDGEVCDSGNLIENGAFDYFEPVVIMADPVLTLNGETKTNLISNSTMNVAVQVENVDDIALMLALYKNGALEYVTLMEKSTSGSDELYETGLLVPDTSEDVYTAKVMYWETLTGLKPLRGAFEITE